MMSEYEKAKRRFLRVQRSYAKAVYDLYKTSSNPDSTCVAAKYSFFGIGVICQATAARKF